MQFASISAPSSPSKTYIEVHRRKISGSMLFRSDGRCKINTKAIPQSAGRCSKKRWNASIPPAEAPIPTIGNAAPLEGAEGGAAGADVTTRTLRSSHWITTGLTRGEGSARVLSRSEHFNLTGTGVSARCAPSSGEGAQAPQSWSSAASLTHYVELGTWACL